MSNNFSLLVYEVFWNATLPELMLVLVSIPGLILWTFNYGTSLKAKRAIRRLELQNGRGLVARFQARATMSLAILEAMFIFIGVVLMSYTRPPGDTFVRQIIYAVAIAILSWISYLGWDWRRSHQRLFDMTKKK